jgi:hypothetical protein
MRFTRPTGDVLAAIDNLHPKGDVGKNFIARLSAYQTSNCFTYRPINQDIISQTLCQFDSNPSQGIIPQSVY